MFRKLWKKNLAKDKGISFEAAFFQRFKQKPVEFIYTKLLAGSELSAVQYGYEISAEAVARKYGCEAKPFSCYAKEAEMRVSEEKEKIRDARHCGTAAFCRRQFLNGRKGLPFGGACVVEMELLYSNETFCTGISKIAQEFAQVEFCADEQSAEFIRFKKELLPHRMKELGLVDHLAVQKICEYVRACGRAPKSALITIYYAVRLQQVKMKEK